MKRNLRLPRGLFDHASHLCFIEGNGGEGEGPSLRDELAAALTADTAAQAGDATPAAPAAPAPAPAAETQAQADQRARDEAGRFAKQATPATPTPELKTPSGAPEPGATQTIAPPSSWTAAAKAEFSKLPPIIQQEVLKREGDIEAGKAQWQTKAERFNALDSILAPRRERLQLAGMSEVQAVQALFAAQDMLERQPREAIAYLARQYGVDLRSYGQGGPGTMQPAQQPAIHPAFQQVFNEINTLKGALAQQQQQSATQAAQSQHVQTITQFQADPKNIYFENVRPQMAELLRSKQAPDLQTAYDMATWASPEIRPLLLRAQQDQAAAEAQAAARAKATAARHASGSVVGSPTPGSSAAASQPAESIRDELARAFADAS